MSQKKIIFFVIVGIISVLALIGIFLLTNQSSNKKTNSAAELAIWINEWTQEDFKKLEAGFHKYAPEYKNITITPTKQPNDADRYRSYLLQTIAEWNGPDIFMLQKWEDKLLENWLQPIPQNNFNIADFSNRFEEVFDGLIKKWSKDNEETIDGIPLGYETLGVFYNRTLVRPSVPRTWQELENMYNSFVIWKYPSNLWLGSNFVPNVSDILPLFFAKDGMYDYKSIAQWVAPFESYYTFWDLTIGSSETTDDIYSRADTLRHNESVMQEQKKNTFDEFLAGNIAMIIGYPSTILELEKSKKRVGTESVHDTILSAKIPENNTKTRENIAKYSYMAISKNSKNPDASLAFLSYLSTPEAGRILMEIYPHMIPAQKELQPSATQMTISKEFPRLKMEAFIPEIGTKLQVFDYGNKKLFENILTKNWSNMGSRSDIATFSKKLSEEITCSVEENNPNSPCEK